MKSSSFNIKLYRPISELYNLYKCFAMNYREGFQEFLRRLLEESQNTDIYFKLHDGTNFSAHR